MKKRIMATLLCIVMCASLMSVTVMAEENAASIVKIGDTEYSTVQEAFEACGTNASESTTVTLLCDVDMGTSFGFPDSWVNSGRNIILDLNGHTYKFLDPGMGSKGTETQAMHLIYGNTLYVKNGTLAVNTSSTQIKRMIQNYCDLTLEDVTIDTGSVPSGFSSYNNSFCRSTVTLKGNTKFIASSDKAIIFDVDGSYCKNNCDVALVIDSNFTGSIGGKVEYVASVNEHSSTLTDNANYFSVIQAVRDNKNYFGTIETASANGIVAVNGNKGYTTLGQAFVEAEANDTIKLIKDVALEETVNISNSLTLDMNGYNIFATDTRAIWHHEGTLNIIGKGTISADKRNNDNFSSASSVIRVGDNEGENSALVLGENVIVTSTHCYGITYFGKDTQTVVIDGTVSVSGSAPAISGNGTGDLSKAFVTVNGTVSSENEVAIYNPQDGSLVINGTVKGTGGIEAKSGNTTVSVGNNAKIIATADEPSHNPSSNGTSTNGYAIVVANNKNYKGNASVAVNGGMVDGPIGIVDDNEVEAENQGRIVITGGSFSIDPSEYVDKENGYNVYPSGDRYIVSKSNPSIGGGSAAPSNNNSQEEEVSEEDVPLSNVPSFNDVTEANWYYDDVVYMYMNNLMNGITEETFEPTLTTTRGMIVTILYRMEGSPEVTGNCPFADVNAGSYYEKAITWAAANKIVLGYTADKYAPDQDITREQMAAILYRYASFKGLDVSELADISTFVDASNISAYAVDAIRWANACKLVTGTSETTLDPTGNAQRCQVAAMFHRFAEMMKSEVSE